METVTFEFRELVSAKSPSRGSTGFAAVIAVTFAGENHKATVELTTGWLSGSGGPARGSARRLVERLNRAVTK